jgi:hypothetical protein
MNSITKQNQKKKKNQQNALKYFLRISLFYCFTKNSNVCDLREKYTLNKAGK